MRTGLLAIGIVLLSLPSCHKLSELEQQAELAPLEQGFRTSAAIGYCATLAKSVFTGAPLPENVTMTVSNKAGYTSSGLIHVKVDAAHPVPFNKSVGDIYIAGLWDGDNGGVISIVFGDFNVFTSSFKFYGLYTIPITSSPDGGINTLFAEQDIILGQGSDTLLDLSLSKPKFNTELTRLDQSYSADPFVIVKQNVWFVSIDANHTALDWYDDLITVNGGGQIAEAASNSGGILYHAMIDTHFSFASCSKNPTEGTAFVQNIKAAGSSVDLGNLTLTFHPACDGKAKVLVATGKYITSNGSNISLGWE